MACAIALIKLAPLLRNTFASNPTTVGRIHVSYCCLNILVLVISGSKMIVVHVLETCESVVNRCNSAMKVVLFVQSSV